MTNKHEIAPKKPNWLLRAGVVMSTVGGLMLFGSYGLGKHENHKASTELNQWKQLINDNPFLDKNFIYSELTSYQQGVVDRAVELEKDVDRRLNKNVDYAYLEFLGGVPLVLGAGMLSRVYCARFEGNADNDTQGEEPS